MRACVLFAQDRAHFAIWCIMASPLIAGNDLRSMSNGTRDILTNAHAIAINQDPLGAQATLVAGQQSNAGRDHEGQVWAKQAPVAAALSALGPCCCSTAWRVGLPAATSCSTSVCSRARRAVRARTLHASQTEIEEPEVVLMLRCLRRAPLGSGWVPARALAAHAPTPAPCARAATYTALDLEQDGKSIGPQHGKVEATVASSSAVFLKLLCTDH